MKLTDVAVLAEELEAAVTKHRDCLALQLNKDEASELLADLLLDSPDFFGSPMKNKQAASYLGAGIAYKYLDGAMLYGLRIIACET